MTQFMSDAKGNDKYDFFPVRGCFPFLMLLLLCNVLDIVTEFRRSNSYLETVLLLVLAVL